MQRFVRPNHPFRLLLYLEWILLGIALVAVISTSFRPLNMRAWRQIPPPRHAPFVRPTPPPLNSPARPRRAPDLNRPLRHRRFHRSAHPRRLFSFSALISIGTLGLIGLQLPHRKPPSAQVLHTSLGFGLSWLAVILGGRGEALFPALLLVVVMRACLMFPWSGRLLVAGLAYASFLLRMLFGFLGIHPLGISIGRPLPAAIQALPSEVVWGIAARLTLNSALLFGLVLAFILLLVGALLAEKESRQQLSSANRRLRQYALLIEDQATLQERNRIAREIHDSVGHSLTAQSIQLENVAMLLPQDIEQATQHLQQARQLGKVALGDVRQSVAALRTHPLKGQSLKVALTKLIQEFNQTNSTEFETHIDLSTPLSPEVNMALYRVVQEALTNISKHSHATRVHLALQQSATKVQLLLDDNGQGFNPSANSTGFGLRGMRERVEALGGTFHLSSQPGQGCQIQVEIPRPEKTS
ncbi:MAG: sensor histidine kinase [Cyanothece sp. SIO1E1]|nr:sensor histidine kinase [Cyanothece sp. SIO1E1]